MLADAILLGGATRRRARHPMRMARADLILNLVRAARENDDLSLRNTVEAMIAEERDKQHHVLAERLEDALRRGSASARMIAELEPATGVEVFTPQRPLSSLILPENVRIACEELVEEHQRIDLLRAHGLEPRHRVLAIGPPGNGKTSLAEAIAEALYLPVVRIRYEAVIGSYLGETAARLAKVFDYARTRRCVLFLDEFDAIAKERGDEHETGEIKRVVSSLLLLVDELPSHVLVVAASNHPELLDRAVHRRFEMHLTLPSPDHAQRAAYFEIFLARFPGATGYSARRLADATEGASFSRLQDLTMDIRRRILLDPDRELRLLIAERLRRFDDDVN
jgi:SpoVK/Ycf46/Vps4 family AAA+-type ATPase